MPRWLFPMLEPNRAVRNSKIRAGDKLRVQGVPAILVGVACIVAAAGLSRALQAAVPILPDALREAREFWLVVRGERRLNP